MRPPGVTNHYSRIVVEDARAISDETFMEGTLEISRNTIAAVKGVLTAAPDYLVMGMSAVTFYGGKEGSSAWKRQIEDVARMGVSIGAEALVAAIRAYGDIHRVAFLSPYYPVANDQVKKYLADHEIEVVRDICLRCPRWTAIAEVSEKELSRHLLDLDCKEADALLQVGTNLSMVRLAAAAERFFGKPVIAINTATYWHALRSNGIDDKISGFGSLLEKF